MKTLFCQKPASSKIDNIIGLALLSYSLLSPLIKHAMILNMLRRYQLSPPPSVMVKTRANFSLLLTQSEPGVRSSGSGKLRLFVGLWEGERTQTHNSDFITISESRRGHLWENKNGNSNWVYKEFTKYQWTAPLLTAGWHLVLILTKTTSCYLLSTSLPPSSIIRPAPGFLLH